MTIILILEDILNRLIIATSKVKKGQDLLRKKRQNNYLQVNFPKEVRMRILIFNNLQFNSNKVQVQEQEQEDKMYNLAILLILHIQFYPVLEIVLFKVQIKIKFKLEREIEQVGLSNLLKIFLQTIITREILQFIGKIHLYNSQQQMIRILQIQEIVYILNNFNKWVRGMMKKLIFLWQKIQINKKIGKNILYSIIQKILKNKIQSIINKQKKILKILYRMKNKYLIGSQKVQQKNKKQHLLNNNNKRKSLCIANNKVVVIQFLKNLHKNQEQVQIHPQGKVMLHNLVVKEGIKKDKQLRICKTCQKVIKIMVIIKIYKILSIYLLQIKTKYTQNIEMMGQEKNQNLIYKKVDKVLKIKSQIIIIIYKILTYQWFRKHVIYNHKVQCQAIDYRILFNFHKLKQNKNLQNKVVENLVKIINSLIVNNNKTKIIINKIIQNEFNIQVELLLLFQILYICLFIKIYQQFIQIYKKFQDFEKNELVFFFIIIIIINYYQYFHFILNFHLNLQVNFIQLLINFTIKVQMVQIYLYLQQMACCHLCQQLVQKVFHLFILVQRVFLLIIWGQLDDQLTNYYFQYYHFLKQAVFYLQFLKIVNFFKNLKKRINFITIVINFLNYYYQLNFLFLQNFQRIFMNFNFLLKPVF